MSIRTPNYAYIFLFITGLCIFGTGCTSLRGDDTSHDAAQVHQETSVYIKESVLSLSDKNIKREYPIFLSRPELVTMIYERNGYVPVWSHEQKWLSTGDSLFSFIKNSQYFGLFPEDYHSRELLAIRQKIFADSSLASDGIDPRLWANADLLLTDAFMAMVHDIKWGRIPADSLTERSQASLADSAYMKYFDGFQRGTTLVNIMESLEPSARGYKRLKAAIPQFLKRVDDKTYTKVPTSKEPSFQRALQRRLFEGGYLAFDSVSADSVQLAEAVKKFQKERGLAVDGRAGEATIREMNVSDREKFIRIAISLDKYKLLPDQMPDRYIWVNASANYLELIENGDVKLFSKVICGKPRTRTPLLTSKISELITYPQWVPPPSIVSKEILPAVKKNPDYLRKKGFSLQDRDGNEVDPDSVDWSRYRTMPYRVVQGSGDANALGIMKFVFSNKYSVYLHDTNQRYLFSSVMRSLSHGCVRVQEWEQLAEYIIRSDSPGENGLARIDSMKQWLSRKVKRSIPIRNKLPVYIRYFTCEGSENGIAFYDDVYGEDRYLMEKYFAGK